MAEVVVGSSAVVVYGALADMQTPAGHPVGSLFVVDTEPSLGFEFSVGGDGNWFSRNQIGSNTKGEAATNVVAEVTSRPGTWHSETFDDVSNVLQSKELPIGVIELRATYYGVASAVGVAMGIAIGALNAVAGEASIDGGASPQLVIDKEPAEWDFDSDDAVTRVDFKTMVAETGTSKFVLEWKVVA